MVGDVRIVYKGKKVNINHGPSLNTAKSDFERKRGNEIDDLPCKPPETCESNKLEFFGNSLRNNLISTKKNGENLCMQCICDSKSLANSEIGTVMFTLFHNLMVKFLLLVKR